MKILPFIHVLIPFRNVYVIHCTNLMVEGKTYGISKYKANY